MIISRYLIKEVLQTLIALTFILLLVFLSQQLVRYLSYAASGKIAANVLVQIIGYEIPILLAVLLPLGLYLGVMLTYSRLYTDNELRVMHACGLSSQQLARITAVVALLVCLMVSVLVFWINPSIAAAKDKALEGGSAVNILDTIIPGRFQVSNEGRRVIYVEKMTRNHKEAKNIFIAEQQKPSVAESAMPWVVLSANQGYEMVDHATKQPFVVANDGYRYEGVPGQNNYKIIQFQKYAVRLTDNELSAKRQITEAIPTMQLFKNYHNPDNASELQWRLSIPLSALLLTFIAIPLSQVKPRQGRYATLFPAILIYVVYMNLLFVGRNLVEQKMVSTTLGLWWVHLLILGLILVMSFNWRRRRT